MHTYVRVHPYTWRDIDGWTTISRYFNAAPCYRSGLGLRHRVLRSCLLPRNSPFPVPKRSQLFICDAELASFFCCADCLGARLEGYNRAQRRNSQLHVFLTAPHQNQEPQRGIEPRAVLSVRYGILLSPKGPKPPRYSPRRSLRASACERPWRRRPAVTSFNGSRSRTLMLSLFCFFISGVPF